MTPQRNKRGVRPEKKGGGHRAQKSRPTAGSVNLGGEGLKILKNGSKKTRKGLCRNWLRQISDTKEKQWLSKVSAEQFGGGWVQTKKGVGKLGGVVRKAMAANHTK